ncbi:hypothetical protein ACLB2K_054895 [Fragaria x ananassa]
MQRSGNKVTRKGYVPVLVGKQGDEDDLMEKLWMPIKLLDHPRIVVLLKNSADEFGFRQQGLLKIVTQDVHLFKGSKYLIDATTEVDRSRSRFRNYKIS